MNEALQNLQNDILTLRNCVLHRIQQHFKNETDFDLSNACSSFSFADNLQISDDEKTILLIALIPHLQPDFFESVIQEVLPQGGDFPLFGGAKGSNHRGLLPTGETAQFIIAGTDLKRRIEVQNLLLNKSKLTKQNIIELESVKEGEPLMSGRLLVSEEWLNKILFGKNESQKFSSDFPAKQLT
ncbi:MAG: ATP-binding protein, partial [Bacteroidota bacterium]|nr:ATP-binding protein [Bacteroidota bacterium]